MILRELSYNPPVYAVPIHREKARTPMRHRSFSRVFASTLALMMVLGSSFSAAAFDLLPSFFDKPAILKSIWKEQEQYVALTTQGKKGTAFPRNAHPATLDGADIRDALKSVEVWSEGGFFRNEEAHPIFTDAQCEVLGRYLADALLKAKSNEDVIFNVRGYGKLLLDSAKEKEWTSGRVFFVDGKLNLIIGTYHLKKDRGIKGAEASAGILDNYNDLVFDPGNRTSSTSKMEGRIVSSAGITIPGAADGGRNDWIVIAVPTAAQAYREAQIPEEQKRTTEKSKQEAAKLTLERREMREEMARMRQQIKAMQGTGASVGAGSNQSPEERLGILEKLHAKKLISDDEYQRRRDEILKDI